MISKIGSKTSLANIMVQGKKCLWPRVSEPGGRAGPDCFDPCEGNKNYPGSRGSGGKVKASGSGLE